MDSSETLGRRMPRKVYERLFNPVDELFSFPDTDVYQEACSLMCSFFGRGAWKGEEKDQWQQRDPDWERGNSDLLHEKNLNTPVLWEPKRSDWLRTQPALCFSSAFYIPCLQANLLSLNILGLRLGFYVGILPAKFSGVALSNLDNFHPANCDKVQEGLQIQLLYKIFSQKNPPAGILP